MDYIEKLHDLRRKMGWSILELGLRCDGLSEEAVRSILLKRRVPLISSVEKICTTLGISLSELFCETDEIVIKATPETCTLISAFETLPVEAKNLVVGFLKLHTQ